MSTTNESLNVPTVHILDLPTRSFRLEITDRGDKIEFALWFSKIGDLGDVDEFMKWAQPLYAKYDRDQRPQVHTSLNWDEKFTVLDDGKHFAILVGQGKKQ